MNKVKAFSGSSVEEVAEKINKWVDDTGAKIESQPTLATGGVGGSACQVIVAYSGGKEPKTSEVSQDQAESIAKKELHLEKNEEETAPVDKSQDILTDAERARLKLEGEEKKDPNTMGDIEAEKKKTARAEEVMKGEGKKPNTGGKKK